MSLARSLVASLCLVSAGVASCFVTPAESHALCAMPQYRARLITPVDRVPTSGAMLVSVESGFGHAGASARATSDADTHYGLILRLRAEPEGDAGDEHETVALEPTIVGPGLLALRAPSPLAPGRYALVGLGEEPLTITVVEATPSTPPAPVIASFRHEERVTEHPRGGGRSWEDDARFGAPLPANAFALLVRFANEATRFDVTPGATELSASHGYSRCGGTGPAGNSRVSYPNATAVLVDRFGQVGPASTSFDISQVGALASSRSRSSSATPGGASGSSASGGGSSSRCSAGGADARAPWGFLSFLTLVFVARLRRRPRRI